MIPGSVTIEVLPFGLGLHWKGIRVLRVIDKKNAKTKTPHLCTTALKDLGRPAIFDNSHASNRKVQAAGHASS